MIILRPADAAFGVVGPRGGWSQLVLDPYTSSPFSGCQPSQPLQTSRVASVENDKLSHQSAQM